MLAPPTQEIFAPLPSLNLRPVANESYRFAKTFSEGDFCAAGSMLIPPGGEKPTKNTRANNMVCFHSLVVNTHATRPKPTPRSVGLLRPPGHPRGSREQERVHRRAGGH